MHARPSEHVVSSAHAAAAVQRPQLATAPSEQRTPVRAVHAVWLIAGWQDWHGLVGLTSPLPRQAPSIAQVPALIGAEHEPVASSHASTVHARPSLQVVSVTHTAAPLHVPQPAVVPSLQRAPVRGDQPFGFAAALHQRHAFPTLTLMSA